MKVREFLVAIPALCGAKNAARIADIFGYVYDRELGKGTPFDRNDEDRVDFDNRSAYLWDMLCFDEAARAEEIVHCRKIMEIIERSHYMDEHGEKFHVKRIDKLYAEVKKVEANFPEIAMSMPADDAIALGGWNG
jgi:hypothetical protein